MLGASTIRNLGQKEYEKRKQAALEVENLVREHRDAGDHDKVSALIAQLAKLFASFSQMRPPSARCCTSFMWSRPLYDRYTTVTGRYTPVRPTDRSWVRKGKFLTQVAK